MNSDYKKLAQIAYDTVLQTMMEGEKTHTADEWKQITIGGHSYCALRHIDEFNKGDKSEDHIAHALTRCAMIKYLEDERK